MLNRLIFMFSDFLKQIKHKFMRIKMRHVFAFLYVTLFCYHYVYEQYIISTFQSLKL